jgi:nucleolar MIF4G domain-containing protein 1
MVSAIMNLKNSKKKREDTVLAEKISKFRKILGRVKASAAKSGISKSTSEASLRISLDDIMQADTKGRWWKVGASWVGNQYRFSENSKQENERPDSDVLTPSTSIIEDGDEELLKLASKFRMNTDRKRAIFCIIMGGTDCEDTFEKLCRSSMLQNRTERDTVRVLMECCGNEKSYNKFYGHLAARICEYQPQSKFSLQLAYWDIFKQFDSLGARKGANLAKLLFHLVVSHQVLKIFPVIKTIDLADDDMDEGTLIFLTIVFSSILEHFNDPLQAKAIFARSAIRAKDETADEGIKAGLLVFFMETLKSSPKNKKNSRFRKNFKAIVKELDTDGFEDMF